MAGGRGHANIEAVVLEESNRKAADVAAAEAAADDDMLGVLPLIELKESRGYRGQFAANSSAAECTSPAASGSSPSKYVSS